MPKDRIVARYHRSLALLPQALLRCDDARIFDNSDWQKGYRLLAAMNERGPLQCFAAADETPWFAGLVPTLRAHGLLDPLRGTAAD